MGLNDIGAKLPPGFRFYPNDEELVCHYLYKKIANEDVLKGTLVEIDLHTCEPWQLPEVAKLNSSEWYFFSFRDRKYATGYRTNRATKSGYWKATGKDRTVVDPQTGGVVGMRKTLVFYKNRAPNGIKTGWIMHEFRLENPHIPPKEDWVLCRVFYKTKGENNTEFSPQNNTFGVTSPNTDISPLLTVDSQPPPCGCHHVSPQNNTSGVTSPNTDISPLLTVDSQPPPCGCHHHITTKSSHQSPPLHHEEQKFLSSSPQKYDYNHLNFQQIMPPNMTMKESTNQTNVSSNNKCENQESSSFLDFGFEYSIPSPLQNFGFIDDDDNDDDGMVFF